MKLPVTRNPFAVAGAFLATFGALFFGIFFLLELFGLHTNPYMGIVFYLILPGLFIFGLLLIPFGFWQDRRKRRRGESTEVTWPRIDLNQPHQRRVAFFVAMATFVNVLIVSLAAYSGVHYMDSNEFCGKVCHTVMAPEYTAFQDSPHSRVGCVQCHIGSGAPWFVKAKISGVRQIFAVAFNTHERPIPSPVHNLRPPRETCEQCHWPEKFHGDKVQVIRAFGDDEQNTESTTTMQVHVGGGSDQMTAATGIHFWHMNSKNIIRFKSTDGKRQVIPWVEIKDRTGQVRTYVADGTKPEDLANAEERVMDCVDCHNRPSHTFAPNADKAVDRGLAMGLIPREIPFVKREATSAVSAAYPTQQAAKDGIAQKMREFYRTNYAQLYASKRPDIERAIAGAQLAYARNVFPEMNVNWGTYPNNIGHMDFPGCFRCHDDSHKATDGKVIKQDCTLCHTMQ
jgi:hypothetical protein